MANEGMAVKQEITMDNLILVIDEFIRKNQPAAPVMAIEVQGTTVVKAGAHRRGLPAVR
jgi:hypothetical protein